jgi:hypothetical protein
LALGTVSLLRDKKYILYTVTLTLSILANYYVGFFVCIFVLLLFFCYELCRFKSVWRCLQDFVRIGVFTVLAIGMTAILELPALAALQDTYSSINKFPEGFQLNMVSGETVTAAQEAWNAFKTAKEAGEKTLPLWWDAIKASFPPVMEGMKTVAGQMAGGLTPITTAAIILTGITASVLGPSLCKLFRLTDEIARGTAFGTAGHVIGTAKASELSPLSGAVSSLSLVVAGLMTAVLFPVITGLL